MDECKTLVPGPYSHGLPYEATREFIDQAADFIMNEGEGKA